MLSSNNKYNTNRGIRKRINISMATDLYKTIKITPKRDKKPPVAQKAYRGFSTVNPENNSFQQFDVSLIKQNLLNHLNIRQGEKLSDPRFGCIIWDALYEPLTAQLKDAITANVTNIVNYDPRTRAASVQVSEYESGLQIECTLMYLDYNISEQLKLQFDKSVGLS